MRLNHIYVRLAKETDTQQFIDWSLANQGRNQFDAEVAAYPTTLTWVAYDKSGVLGYLPVQTPFMLESFAPRPGLSPADTARCMKEFIQEMVTQGHTRGIGEIYFLGTDAETNTLAANQVFEQLPYKVFRLRVKDTER